MAGSSKLSHSFCFLEWPGIDDPLGDFHRTNSDGRMRHGSNNTWIHSSSSVLDLFLCRDRIHHGHLVRLCHLVRLYHLDRHHRMIEMEQDGSFGDMKVGRVVDCAACSFLGKQLLA